jgi:zinc protease
MKTTLLTSLALTVFVAWPGHSAPASDIGSDVSIPFQKFTLKNGLTLIVHEDHKAPIVAVNVWYHVGSKNERAGKTGFAHLFEHLMFNGSEHFNDDYFKATEKVGATDQNGTTSEDRTDYFQNVPREALDYMLWLESDRMGHLLGTLDQARLDEQRGVVQNEKRQGENQPYGLAEELITKGTYPPGHPYSWTVIGSMDDLNAASLDDVREWFKTYYGAANATLVIAGDVKPKEVLAKVEKYFGDIPSGPPVQRQEVWIAKRTGTHRQVAQDRVPQARLYQVWNIPQFGSADADYLTLAADVLAGSKSSRLYKRLVFDEQIASSVEASAELSEIGGRFYVVATARPGVPIEKVERAVNEEMAKFLAHGPTAGELQRAKTQELASFVRGIERIGGFGGKSDVLAQGQVFLGDPAAYKITLKRTREATAKEVQDAARTWLADGVYLLEIRPFPDYTTLASTVDRSTLPVPVLTPTVAFPKLQTATLPNGLKLVLAERHDVPLVNVTLQLDAGYAADQFASPGMAKLAMNLLDEGTASRTALQISDDLDRLGATLTTGSDLDTSVVTLSALKENLEPSLDLFADVVLHPAFREADFKRLQKLQLDAIHREQSEPRTMAMRVVPQLLYGKGHAYSSPFTGSGDVDSVRQLTPAKVKGFYETWFRPNHATLIVVGDTTLNSLLPRLEKRFSSWKAGDIPHKNLAGAPVPGGNTVYLMDRPGAQQSVIIAAGIAPPQTANNEAALETLNHILGGSFTSRLNMNLREDKHWSYGVRSTLVDAVGPRPFLVVAPVQTDKTKETVIELRKELEGVVSTRPPTPEELAKAQKDETLTLAGRWETDRAVANSIAELVRFKRPADYFARNADAIRALRPEDLRAVAGEIVHPHHMVWVIVGDRAKIETGLKQLGPAKLELLQPDGRLASSVSSQTASLAKAQTRKGPAL